MSKVTTTLNYVISDIGKPSLVTLRMFIIDGTISALPRSLDKPRRCSAVGYLCRPHVYFSWVA